MNCKLEKFWNSVPFLNLIILASMNCKLEKFWNRKPEENYIQEMKHEL